MKTKKTKSDSKHFVKIYDRKSKEIIHTFCCPDETYAKLISTSMFCVLQRKFGDRDLSITVADEEYLTQPPREVTIKKEPTTRTAAYEKEQYEKRIKHLEGTIAEIAKEIKINNDLRTKKVYAAPIFHGAR